MASSYLIRSGSLHERALSEGKSYDFRGVADTVAYWQAGYGRRELRDLVPSTRKALDTLIHASGTGELPVTHAEAMLVKKAITTLLKTTGQYGGDPSKIKDEKSRLQDILDEMKYAMKSLVMSTDTEARVEAIRARLYERFTHPQQVRALKLMESKTALDLQLQKGSKGAGQYYRFNIRGTMRGVAFSGETDEFFPSQYDADDPIPFAIRKLSRDDGHGEVTFATKFKVTKEIQKKIAELRKQGAF